MNPILGLARIDKSRIHLEVSNDVACVASFNQHNGAFRNEEVTLAFNQATGSSTTLTAILATTSSGRTCARDGGKPLCKECENFANSRRSSPTRTGGLPSMIGHSAVILRQGAHCHCSGESFSPQLCSAKSHGRLWIGVAVTTLARFKRINAGLPEGKHSSFNSRIKRRSNFDSDMERLTSQCTRGRAPRRLRAYLQHLSFP